MAKNTEKSFKIKWFCLIILSIVFIRVCMGDNTSFSQDFLFGVSTSSYQIEGGWNEGGKGENIWDRFTHTHPERIADHSNGDRACNSYHQFREDVKLLKYLNVSHYRLSLSWSRILPTGRANNINPEAVKYYTHLFEELLKNGIEPVVTLYHWDLPQPLQDLGGWANPVLADYFEEYANVVFDIFRMYVKFWITFNEPKLICVYGYGDIKMAPGVNASGIGDYLCGKTILLAHAKVYHLYKGYNGLSHGKMGIALHTEWFEPDSEEATLAAEMKLQFDLGWFANPIFHVDGNYPTVMQNRIATHSLNQNFVESRLPILTPSEIDLIKGTYDFLGLNYYTASMVSSKLTIPNPNITSYLNDVNLDVYKDPQWSSSAAKRLKVVPWGLRKLLSWIDQQYGNITIIITENGYADHGELLDYKRIDYIHDHLNELLKSIHEDKINVVGYFVWSLMDNFEWFGGYKERYGLFGIDFNDPTLERKTKASAKYFKDIVERKKLILNYDYTKNISPQYCINLFLFTLIYIYVYITVAKNWNVLF